MCASPVADAAMQTVVEKKTLVFVDVCTDKTMAYAAADTRLKQNCKIVAIYHAPETETRHVTSVDTSGAGAGLAGDKLPVGSVPAWVVVSEAAPY